MAKPGLARSTYARSEFLHGTGDPESQHELVKLIVERAYVEDEKVVAMTLRSNYHLVLGHKANGPTFHEVDPLYAHGSDGGRPLTCKKLVVVFLPKYLAPKFPLSADVNQSILEPHYFPAPVQA